MNVSTVVQAILLSLLVLACWLGVIGMLRMREPMQALHYLSLPACLGSVFLVIAVFLRTGNSQASWKTVITCLILFAINSVVTHATARAFRTREIGHWRPQAGDNIERVRKGQGSEA